MKILDIKSSLIIRTHHVLNKTSYSITCPTYYLGGSQSIIIHFLCRLIKVQHKSETFSEFTTFENETFRRRHWPYTHYYNINFILQNYYLPVLNY